MEFALCIDICLVRGLYCVKAAKVNLLLVDAYLRSIPSIIMPMNTKRAYGIVR